MFILLFFIVLFSVNAVQFRLYKDNYKAFETVQFEAYFDNMTLSKTLTASNLALFNNINSINIAKTVVKINDSAYAFYFDLPNIQEGIYNLSLINIGYTKNNNFKIGSFSTDLKIVNGSEDILQIRPGYVLSNITIYNELQLTINFVNKGNNTLNINLENDSDFFDFQKNNIVLVSGASKSVNVLTSIFNQNKPNFTGNIKVNYGNNPGNLLNNYIIPFNIIRIDFVNNPINTNVVLLNNISVNITNLSSEQRSNAFYLTTLSNKILNNISLNLNLGDYYPSGQILVNNNLSLVLYNLTYFIEGNVSKILDISPKTADLIEALSSTVFLLNINNTKNFTEGTYVGNLIVNSSEGAYLNIPVIINVAPSNVVINRTVNLPLNNTNNTNLTLVNYTDIATSSKNSNVFVITIIVFLILLFLIYLVYKKTKSKETEFDQFVDRVKQRRN